MNSNNLAHDNNKTNSPTILIVEDDLHFSQYCQLLIKDMGFSCIAAHSGDEALKIFDSYPHFLLIILDVGLPDMTGFELAKIINQKDKTETPFIFLTVLTELHDVTEGYQLGAIDYITKPVNDVIFKSKLQRIIDSINLRTANKSLRKQVLNLFCELENELYLNSGGLIEINQNLAICFANGAAVKLLGLPSLNVHNISINDILPEDQIDCFNWKSTIEKCCEPLTGISKHHKTSFWFQTGNGERRLIKLHIHLTKRVDPKTFYIHLKDISPVNKDNHLFISPKNIDALTGLSNHAYFAKQCEKCINKVISSNQKIALVLINIEHFSVINDRYGHHVGDLLLKHVAIRLKATLRPYDLVSRLGNDEFAILFDGTPQWGMSHTVVELGNTLTIPLQIEPEMSLNIKCNIGVAFAPSCGDNFSMLYQCAKIALEKARKELTRHFHFYEEKYDQESLLYSQITSLFDDAVSQQEFFIEYQPQFKLDTLEIIGAEALIRWNSKEKGLVSPACFIPLAEASGHIIEIGQWVIKQVASDIGSLPAEILKSFRVAVNLSAVQLVDSNMLILLHQLYQSILDNNLSADNFDLEITEHSFMDVDEKVIQQLRELQAKNFHISLDDFGTGYSSLSYIQRFPLNNLKIDISFVRLIGEDTKVEEIIKLIINLAKTLGLKTIAEGIENQDQLDFLKVNHCDYGQGYLISRPVGLDKLKDML